jgi:hypothetical protein
MHQQVQWLNDCLLGPPIRESYNIYKQKATDEAFERVTDSIINRKIILNNRELHEKGSFETLHERLVTTTDENMDSLQWQLITHTCNSFILLTTDLSK